MGASVDLGLTKPRSPASPFSYSPRFSRMAMDTPSRGNPAGADLLLPPSPAAPNGPRPRSNSSPSDPASSVPGCRSRGGTSESPDLPHLPEIPKAVESWRPPGMPAIPDRDPYYDTSSIRL